MYICLGASNLFRVARPRKILAFVKEKASSITKFSLVSTRSMSSASERAQRAQSGQHGVSVGRVREWMFASSGREFFCQLLMLALALCDLVMLALSLANVNSVHMRLGWLSLGGRIPVDSCFTLPLELWALQLLSHCLILVPFPFHLISLVQFCSPPE